GALGKVQWTRRFGLPWPKVERLALRAVDGVSFSIPPGDVLGLVGESGSGKSTLARLAVRLIEPDRGVVVFGGTRIDRARGAVLKSFRKAVQIVFQNPDSSLNPRRTVGEAISRAVKLHTPVARRDRRSYVETLMDRVNLPRNYYHRYPHHLSDGEKQRVGIARALSTGPTLLVGDEPVSALDVSVQATVLNLFSDLRDQLGLSYLFISHDLSVVAHIAGRIAVMYAGKIVETGSANAVLEPPYHPYTEVLLAAIPSPDPALAGQPRPVLRSDTAAAPPRNRLSVSSALSAQAGTGLRNPHAADDRSSGGAQYRLPYPAEGSRKGGIGCSLEGCERMSEEQAIPVAPPRTVHRGSPQGHPAFHRGGRPARHHGHDREICLGAAVDAPDRGGPLCRATSRSI